METVLIILQALCSIAVIGVIMFQSGKEAGLSGALGGKADTYLSKTNGGNLDKMLASATKWVALVWILLTLSLSFFPV